MIAKACTVWSKDMCQPTQCKDGDSYLTTTTLGMPSSLLCYTASHPSLFSSRANMAGAVVVVGEGGREERGQGSRGANAGERGQ